MRKLSLLHCFRSTVFLPAVLLLLIGWPVAALSATGEGPRAEALVSDSRPYREQTLIYTLRVHHDSSVTEIDPDPIEIAGFAAEKIDGPPETTRRLRGGERLVTEFRYALTPLSEGRFRIPEARVQVISNGRRRQGWNRYEDVHEETEVRSGALNIEVRLPPAESLSDQATWLPLRGLRIDAKQEGGQAVRAGEPFQLTLTQYAWGTGGGQLPSLAPALEGTDFKVYLDQTQTDRKISKDGRMLLGRRVETLTLVPTRGGRLEIPTVQVPWWNLDRQQAGLAQWAGMELEVQPADGMGYDLPTLSLDLELSRSLQLGLTALLAFALGWWSRSGMPGMRPAARGFRHILTTTRRRTLRVLANAEVASAWTKMRSHLAEWLKALRPQLPRWRTLPARHEPRRRSGPVARQLEMRRLRQRIAGATDARVLEREIQTYAQRALGMRANSSLHSIGQGFAAGFPRLDGPALQHLLDDLDAYLYGGADSLDLALWVARFRRLSRDIGLKETRARGREAALPVLNPSIR